MPKLTSEQLIEWRRDAAEQGYRQGVASALILAAAGRTREEILAANPWRKDHEIDPITGPAH